MVFDLTDTARLDSNLQGRTAIDCSRWVFSKADEFRQWATEYSEFCEQRAIASLF